MISLNEAHHMKDALWSLEGWAQEVFLVDSYSRDETVQTALDHGVHVVQRPFRGFGDQWNFALRELPITASWTMKLDPDERMSDALKAHLLDALAADRADAFSFDRRLWFMGREMPARQSVLRIWRTGSCLFSAVSVNEHPIVDGRTMHVAGELAHIDSPDLDHWLEKQNRYTTAEAIIAHEKAALSAAPKLLGNALQRRMWLKKIFYYIPFRYTLLFLYHWLGQGAWRAGFAGYAWARLRADVMRLVEYKRREIALTGRIPSLRVYGPGEPDKRVQQYR
jgi:glycosyltransferase involved in cell wall biosynthesis